MRYSQNICERYQRGVEILGKPYEKQRHLVGYVPQRGSVDWDFPTTVLDVVMMGRYGSLGWLRRPGRRERDEAMRALRHAVRLMGETPEPGVALGEVYLALERPDESELMERGGVAVDLGCGNGWYLRALARHCPNLRGIGLDGFAENVRQARALAEAESLAARLEFREGDLHHFTVTEPVLVPGSCPTGDETVLLTGWDFGIGNFANLTYRDNGVVTDTSPEATTICPSPSVLSVPSLMVAPLNNSTLDAALARMVKRLILADATRSISEP